MEFKGTKGEWKVGKSDGIKTEKGFKSKYVVETEELVVCDFIISKGYKKQSKRDAKLISAAPELLNALTSLLNETRHYNPKCGFNTLYLKEARTESLKAINKALN